ncbi:MAG: hypothetical protein OEY38_00155 [Gammaproteobacteria bacterium]|nr:hypothetical protein [Gammaproteobacteria bacterium]
MLPDIVSNFYKSNLKWCYDGVFSAQDGKFIVTQDDKNYFEKELGIRNADSAFIDFYTLVAIPVVGNGSEISTLEKIIEDAESGEYSSLPGMEDYLRISSIEGEGSYFYSKVSDEVFDVSWGEEEKLSKRMLQPIYKSFFDFLEWYYTDK